MGAGQNAGWQGCPQYSGHPVSRRVAVVMAPVAESTSSASTVGWDGRGACARKQPLRGALQHDLGRDF